MNLMIPSTRNKDDFVLSLGTLEPDSLQVCKQNNLLKNNRV